MSKTFTNPGHTDRILQKLWTKCQKEDLCDIVLIAGNENKRIPALSAVLTEASEYFDEMLTSQRQGTSKEVKMSDVNGDTLQRLIQYCYVGRVVISEDVAVELLKTAHMLRLREVVTACGDFLGEQLNLRNYLELTLLAEKYHCELLLQKTKKYSLENFMDISRTNEFLQFSAAQLKQLLTCDDLHVPAEADVFGCLKVWLDHDPIEREQHKVELLKLVRMPLLEEKFLFEHVKPICTSVESLQIYMEAIESHLPSACSMPNTSNLTKSRRLTEILMSITNCSSNKLLINYYCPQRQKWMQCLKKLEYRSDFGVAIVRSCLYIIGGTDYRYKAFKTVICLDLQTMILTETTPMLEERYSCSAVELNGLLYVVGGQNGSGTINSVEKFSPETKKWYKVAPMSVNRSSAGAVVLNGKLYVTGGYSTFMPFNLAECYNPIKDVWQSIAPMRESRKLHGVAIANGLLYAVSGFPKPMTAERYDPKTNKWTFICNLHEKSYMHSPITTLNDKIIVSYENYFKEYDALTNEWKAIESLEKINNIQEIFSYSGEMLTSHFTEK